MGAAIDAVHRGGGLFIADEVQCGFGRTGTSMWGFGRHGVRPDVVTFGKPMGNGYPIGAVATRPEILDGFCSKYGYFNTFAGTPMAAAVGQAVLDVIQREGLMENARRVGKYLKSELRTFAARHAVIAEVRGSGLYLGVELVAQGSGSPAPAPALAAAVLNSLRDRRVLIGAAGRYGNVLKIRPPLCFSMANAGQLISALDDVLMHLAEAPAARRPG
jgi:4-aminobutyrate aminotransferase-like enzyme